MDLDDGVHILTVLAAWLQIDSRQSVMELYHGEASQGGVLEEWQGQPRGRRCAYSGGSAFEPPDYRCID